MTSAIPATEALQAAWSGTAASADWAVLAACESNDVADGLRLQLAVLDRWQAAGETLGGWKVACCSRGARDAMGPGIRPFGYVLGRRVFASGVTLPLSEVGQLRLEPEICLTIGRPLAGRDVTPEQARSAVAAVRAGYEIGQSRLPAGMSVSIRVANGLNNWGIVLGSAPTTPVDLTALDVTLYHDGELADTGRSEPSVVDDPYLSLSRLCHTLAEHGRGLHPGQHVITGSVLGARAITVGNWRADFDRLGSVSITVSPDL